MKTIDISNDSNNFKILDEKVGNILNKFPNAKTFFDKYNIDYCCNGQKILGDVLRELNVFNQTKINELIETLKTPCNIKLSEDNEVIKTTDFVYKESPEVIDFILDYFHEGLRNKIPEISSSLLKIMKIHIKLHKELFWKIHELFCKIRDMFESHLILEEENIFKAMIKFNNGEISKDDGEYLTMIESIKEASNEHLIVGSTLKELYSITNGYTVPENSCDTVEYVYAELQKLHEHILAHTQVENNILFPRYLNQN